MLTEITQHPMLDAFDKVVPLLKVITGEQWMVGLNNRENCMKFYSGEADHGMVPEGEQSKVKKGSAAYECMEKGEVVIKKLDKETFGFSYRAIGFPVKDKMGKVVGSIGVGVDLGKQEQVLELSKHIASQIIASKNHMSSIAEKTNNSVDTNKLIENRVQGALEDASSTDDILLSITSIAKKLNLLGLNASIEAARAGEAGRGFNIVAEEVRKLSDFSSDLVRQAQSILEVMKASITEVSCQIQSSNDILKEEALQMMAVSENIEALGKVAEELESLSENF